MLNSSVRKSFIVLFIMSGSFMGCLLNKSQPPMTRQEKNTVLMHGVKVRDPYQWLEADTDEVQRWVFAQNEYAKGILKKLPAREKISKRLQDLYYLDSYSVPVARGKRYFFMARKGMQELPVLCVQDGLNGEPRVLIDANTLSGDKTTVLAAWFPSRDGKLLVYTLSESANDAKTLYIINVDTKEILSDIIPSYVYPVPYNVGISWAVDGKGFWYLRRPIQVPAGEEEYHQKVYFHELGTNWENDQLVFGQDLAKEDIPFVEPSEDGQWLLIKVEIYSLEQKRTELYLQNLTDKKHDIVPLLKGPEVQLDGMIHRGHIYVITNDQASRWKIIAADVYQAYEGKFAWHTIIPEGLHKINGFNVVQDTLWVEFLENVTASLKLYDLQGNLVKDISLPVKGTISCFSAEKEGGELFFEFQSFIFPKTIYRLDLSGNYEIFKQVPTDIESNVFEVKQVWYPSKDGTQIPMFICHKKGIELNGKNPTLLYGYGGFNIDILPAFDKNNVMFLEQGGVYAVPNLRGGGEFGEEWHKAGTLDKKQNVFDDFIAAAEWLIDNNYTNSQRLAAFGWSNGGLLTGAMLTQRPDLFKTIVIGAPVQDMLKFHKFNGGRYWISDFGNPDQKEHFKFLYKYSPYHRLEEGIDYPATLILTADKDDRVHPMHAFKMIARLQSVNKTKNPMVMRVDMNSGHAGAASLSKALEQFTDMWSFVFWQLGMK